jgi:uncharacterized protein
MTAFEAILLGVSVVAGAIASVTGFGIGSILTPLLALQAGTKVAVAVITIPHFVATLIRFWLIKSHVNKQAIISFGLTSAVGGLLGALLHSTLQSRSLQLVFGILLVFAGFSGLTGLSRKMRFHGPLAWIAGALSGIFGGLVGNQGGIRSAGLMTFDLSKQSLIATSTAIGVLVDLARLPVYLYSSSQELLSSWPWILLGTVGVVSGTFLGLKVLKKIPESSFRKVLGGLILLLGIYMLATV